MSFLRLLKGSKETSVSVAIDEKWDKKEIFAAKFKKTRTFPEKASKKDWKKAYFKLNKNGLLVFREKSSTKALHIFPVDDLNFTKINYSKKFTLAILNSEKTLYIKTSHKDLAEKLIEEIMKIKEALMAERDAKDKESSLKYEKAWLIYEMNTVNAILDDELGIEYFQKFLESEYSDSQLLFWKNVNTLIELIEDEHSKGFPPETRTVPIKTSTAICDEYVYEGKDRTINIGLSLREPIIKWNEAIKTLVEKRILNKWDKDKAEEVFEDATKLYKIAQQDVFLTLRNTFRRFKRSKFFKSLTEELNAKIKKANIQRYHLRADCQHKGCGCPIFNDNKSSALSTCSECNHFYEEHQSPNLTKTVTPEKEKNIEMKKLNRLLEANDKNVTLNTKKDKYRVDFIVETVVKIIESDKNYLEFRSVDYDKKIHEHCFIGSDLLECFKKQLNITSKESLGIMQEMMSFEMFAPVIKTQSNFVEGKFFYQFKNSEIESAIAKKVLSSSKTKAKPVIAKDIGILSNLYSSGNVIPQTQQNSTNLEQMKTKRDEDENKESIVLLEREEENILATTKENHGEEDNKIEKNSNGEDIDRNDQNKENSKIVKDDKENDKKQEAIEKTEEDEKSEKQEPKSSIEEEKEKKENEKPPESDDNEEMENSSKLKGRRKKHKKKKVKRKTKKESND